MTDAVFNLDRFKSKRQPATAAPSSPTAQVTPTKLQRSPELTRVCSFELTR